MIIYFITFFVLLLVTGIVTLLEYAVITFDFEDEELEIRDKIFARLEELISFSEIISGMGTFIRVLLLTANAFLLYVLTYAHLLTYEIPVSSTLGKVHFLAALFVFGGVYVVLSYLIPKVIGQMYSQKIAPKTSLFVFLMVKLFYYPIKLLKWIADLLLKPLGAQGTFVTPYLTENEIRALIEEGVKSGAIDETEHEFIENVFEFNDLKAREIMIPRTEMIAVELTDDTETVFDEILKTGHSLVPMYSESPDNIIGVLHIKDLMRSFVQKKSLDVKGLIRPAYFVPETKLISEILKEMQTRGERICIVTDEYGGTEGVITLEDILSEIVGEINESGEVISKEYTKLPDGTYSILGSMDIDDFNDIFDQHLPYDEKYNTIAGFISFNTGKILNVGEVYKSDELIFELIKKVKQKMVQFKVYSESSELKVNE